MTDMNFNAPGGGVGGQAGGFGGNQPVSKTKWIVQLVVSVLCLGNPITLILAILGLVKADTDLESANKYYKWGWIVYAILAVLWVIGIILYFVFVGAMIANAPTEY
ncbi:hypothetical protein [Brachybacterium sacelli]|uniref:Cardiolipin synthase N-terminal domain-containing protein n=1 Tax=Brachybacterium sacelli TaxID=173364 RepID=A0ABS4X0G9_9MICO|nr:hypothetical protein [Brachybacterium sacelli]MBP2381888.1 hypothetical protein [Brachybacterium sacelli]